MHQNVLLLGRVGEEHVQRKRNRRASRGTDNLSSNARAELKWGGNEEPGQQQLAGWKGKGRSRVANGGWLPMNEE